MYVWIHGKWVQRDSLKTTWMHPRSKHWILLDYILVRESDKRDVLHTRVMPSAECHTDHRLVRCKLNLHFKPKPRNSKAPRKRFNVGNLQSDEARGNFQANLKAKLDDATRLTDPSPETLWDQLKTTILQSTEEVLGFSSRKNKDWFDENSQEIQELLAKKRAAHQAHLTKPSCPEKKQAFRRACSHLQRKLREIQNEWWTSLAKRTQLSADIGDFRGFYEALKAVYGPSPQVQSPLRSSDGKVLLSDKIFILNRWSEHFQPLFSANRSVQDFALLQPLRLELDEVLTLDETYKAIEQLKSGKAAGMDGIPPEVWKAGGKTLHAKLHEFFQALLGPRKIASGSS
ncbi:uncharacterized protein [Narcine bancroftii]|uniref:uncharacterized protein isoform X2 n=1 Tax=Narcine bancroftii TaxID=1343680 RepID=UPI003831B531